jgi:hypothetical protein
MSDDTWLDNNNRYLEASLHWLRLRLGRLLPPEPPQPAAPPAPSAAPGEAALTEPAAAAGPGRRFWSRRPGLADPLAAPVLLTTSSGTPAGADGLLAAAVAEREAAAGCDPAPALVLLAQRLDLSPF